MNTRLDNARRIKAPRGQELSCRSWQTFPGGACSRSRICARSGPIFAYSRGSYNVQRDRCGSRENRRGQAGGGRPAETVLAIARIVELLALMLVEAHRSGLAERETLARGLALVRGPGEEDGRCESCGYPLSGLKVSTCPNCGRAIAH